MPVISRLDLDTRLLDLQAIHPSKSNVALGQMLMNAMGERDREIFLSEFIGDIRRSPEYNARRLERMIVSLEGRLIKADPRNKDIDFHDAAEN